MRPQMLWWNKSASGKSLRLLNIGTKAIPKECGIAREGCIRLIDKTLVQKREFFAQMRKSLVAV